METLSLAILDNLHSDLAPLAQQARKLVDQTARIAPRMGTLQLAHRPEMAPEAYVISVFPPLPPARLERFAALNQIEILPYYREMLGSFNGCHAFQLSLFGVPPSMASDAPQLDRTVLQPFDISNQARIPSAQRFGWLRFGAGPWSYDENVSYFLSPDGDVRAIRDKGDQVAYWKVFPQFLDDELTRVEEAWPAHERLMTRLLHEPQRHWWSKFAIWR